MSPRQQLRNFPTRLALFVFVVLFIFTGLWLVTSRQNVTADTEAAGSISGVVRDVTGATAGGVEVQLYRNDDLYYSLQRTVSDANGGYRFGLLSAGLYRLAFNDPSKRYLSPQYYQNAVGVADASDIAVAGAPVNGVDMVLRPGGQVRGRVTTLDGGALANVEVRAYSQGNSSQVMQRAQTDNSGNYVVTGLASGFYYVEFYDLGNRHYASFYGNSRDYYDAIPIGVSAGGSVEQLDIALRRGASISGLLTDRNGQPLVNISVNTLSLDALFDVTRTKTDQTGRYTVGPLAANTYLVYFRDLTSRYEDRVYHNPEFLTLPGIAVGNEQELTGIDVTLNKNAIVQGTVTNIEGLPLAGVRVRALRGSLFSPRSTAFSDAQGNYLLEGLAPDQYQIHFSTPDGLYQQSFYSNVVTLSAATWITASQNDIITNVNASLSLGGAITGIVSAADDSILGDIILDLLPQSAPVTETISVYSYTLTSRYTYTIGGLAPGVYRVRASSRYRTEYYDDATSANSATPVTVTLGQFQPNINFVLNDNADAGSITGTVRTPSGEPLAGVTVRLYCEGCTPIAQEAAPAEPVAPAVPATAATGWQVGPSTTTNADGVFRLTGLAPRTYRLRFSPYGAEGGEAYAFEYYNDAIDLASASDLLLAPRSAISEINATLGPGGAISGVIRLDDGSLVRQGMVRFHFWDGFAWQEMGTSRVNELTSAYLRPSLQTGKYRVEVYGIAGDSYRYFYGNTDVFSQATDVAVTAGLTLPNINITLPNVAFFNAGVTGKVTAQGQPVAGIRVELYRYGGRLPLIYTSTDNTGEYALRGLNSGDYFVSFVDPTGLYATAYQRGQITFAEANRLALDIGSNAVITAVNAELSPGGAIRGRVTDLLNKGVGQIEVTAYTRIQGGWQKAAPLVHTDSNGFYILQGLPPGIYRLGFVDPLPRFDDRYYGDVYSIENSPNFEAVAGVTVVAHNVLMADSVPALNRRVHLPIVAR